MSIKSKVNEKGDIKTEFVDTNLIGRVDDSKNKIIDLLGVSPDDVDFQEVNIIKLKDEIEELANTLVVIIDKVNTLAASVYGLKPD